jgi:ankyrin repeat protein
LRYRANINIADSNGLTALMHACAPQHFDEDGRENMAMEFIRLLLERGANVAAQDFKGRTAADYAAEHELYKVEAFLRADARSR